MTNNNSPNTTGSDKPENPAYSGEDEIDLIELIKPLWQQKILIATITLLTIAAAIILVLQATPQYEIYTQLKPGTYRWDDKGNPVPYLKTCDLKNLLTGGIFDTYTTKVDLGEKAPEVGAKSDRNGNQLTTYFFWPNPAEGKKIMAGFIDFLNNPDHNPDQNKLSGLQIQRLSLEKSITSIQEKIKATNIGKQKVELNIDQKEEELKLVDLQTDRLKREIDRVNADLEMTKKEVTFLDERIAVTEDTRAGYEKSRQEIDENTTKIISLRDKLLQAPPDDSLQLLLLASTIQQNISYLNTIEQKIATSRKEVIANHKSKEQLIRKQENFRLKIADLQDEIALEIPKKKSDIQKAITKLKLTVNQEIPSKIFLLNQNISETKDKINTISLIEVIKSPEASIKPVKPKKRKIVALAGIMGLFLATIIAYIRHFISTAKLKIER